MKKRLQFDFTPRALERLERVKTRIEAASRAETVRRAIRFLDRATAHEAEGGQIIARAADGTEYIIELL